MLTIAVDPDHLVLVRADGQLPTSDYVDFVGQFEEIAARIPEPLLMLVELGANFGGWNLDTLFRDQSFALNATPRVRRIAILGEERWRSWGAGESYARLADEIRFFPREAKSDAIAWLRRAGQGDDR